MTTGGCREPGDVEATLGPYRVINLSKLIDPATETRRCKLARHETLVQGVADFHTDLDIVTHLGTHVEAPYHHGSFTKDVVDVPFDHYVARGVLLHLESGPRALISQADLRGRRRPELYGPVTEPN